MSELTKEWLLKTIEELEEERDAVPGVVNEDAAMALAAMKRALASLMAEPDYYVVVTSVGVWQSFCKTKAEAEFIVSKPFNPGYSILEIYTAPPAPVVPAEIRNRLKAEGLAELLKDARGYEPLTAEQWETLTNNWHQTFVGLSGKAYACRAAMLQGAEPVTTANKLPEPIKDNRLNSGAEADDYYSGYQAGWNECLESVQVICEGNPDAK